MPNFTEIPGTSKEARGVTNPPVNIALSFSMDLAKEFLQSGVIQSGDDQFLFNSQNTGFISLTHTVEKKLLELELVDPGAQFLSKFLANNLIENIDVSGNVIQRLMYISYGLGADPTQWAGPLSLFLTKGSYDVSPGGQEIIRLTFRPNLLFASELATADSFLKTLGSTSIPNTTRVLVGTMKSRGFESKYGVAKSRLLDFDLGDGLGLLHSIETLYRNVLKSFGINNFIMLNSTAFLDVFNNATVFSNVKRAYSFKGSQDALVKYDTLVRFLADMGIHMYDTTNTVTDSAQGFPLTITNNKGVTSDIYIDLNQDLKEDRDIEHMFSRFYKTLESYSNKTQTNLVLWEDHLKYISALNNHAFFGINVSNQEEPALIVGNSHLVKKFVYGYKLTEDLNPLFPDYADEEYLKFARALLRNKYVQGNYYALLNSKGKVGVPQSEFDIGNIDSEFGEESIVLFSTNTEQANILDYSFDTDLMTFVALSRRIRFDSDPKKFKDTIITELKKYANSGGNSQIAYSKANVVIDFEAMADALISSLSKADDGEGMILTSSDTNAALISYIQFFWNVAVNGYIKGTIKTVPHYYMSDIDSIFERCLVSISKNPDPYQQTRQFDIRNTVYSGIYRILGIRHTISSTGSHSTFEIVKDAAPLLSKGIFSDLDTRGFIKADAS